MSRQNQDLFLQEENEHDGSDATMIHLAAQANDLEMLHDALEQNVDINAVTVDGWSALHFAAYKGYADMVNALLEAGIDPEIEGNIYKRTALHYAVNQGHIDVVRALLAFDPNLKELKDAGGKTARDIALEKGFADIAKLVDLHS